MGYLRIIFFFQFEETNLRKGTENKILHWFPGYLYMLTFCFLHFFFLFCLGSFCATFAVLYFSKKYKQHWQKNILFTFMSEKNFCRNLDESMKTLKHNLSSQSLAFLYLVSSNTLLETFRCSFYVLFWLEIKNVYIFITKIVALFLVINHLCRKLL